MKPFSSIIFIILFTASLTAMYVSYLRSKSRQKRREELARHYLSKPSFDALNYIAQSDRAIKNFIPPRRSHFCSYCGSTYETNATGCNRCGAPREGAIELEVAPVAPDMPANVIIKSDGTNLVESRISPALLIIGAISAFHLMHKR